MVYASLLSKMSKEGRRPDRRHKIPVAQNYSGSIHLFAEDQQTSISTLQETIAPGQLQSGLTSTRMSAFPPHKTLTSLPVSQAIALKFLTSYLEATKTTPHFLPNARLEPNGITAVFSSSVSIHNLERVQAGLRGEWLAPVLDLGEDVTGEEVQVAGGLEAPQGDEMDVEGWQDLSEYQREQSIEEGEVGPRQTGIAQEGDSDFEGAVEIDGEDEAPKAKKIKTAHSDVNGTSKTIDKEARKREKKLKLKEMRKKRKEKDGSEE